MTGDWKRHRIGSALRGENPTVLRRLDAGFAVIGDTRFLPGYCVLLADSPRCRKLTDLPRPRRLAAVAGRPVWLYPVENRADSLGPQHDSLRSELTAEIDRLRAMSRTS